MISVITSIHYLRQILRKRISTLPVKKHPTPSDSSTHTDAHFEPYQTSMKFLEAWLASTSRYFRKNVSSGSWKLQNAHDTSME